MKTQDKRKLGFQAMAFRCPNELHERASIMAGALRLTRQAMLQEAVALWVEANTDRAVAAIRVAGLAGGTKRFAEAVRS